MSQLERNRIVLIGKDVNITATNLGNLAEGELCVLKQDGTLLTAGETISDTPYITIVRGGATTGDHYFSQKITGANVKRWKGSEYAAAVEQVTYIGSDGANGSISPVTDSTEYTLHIIFKNDKTVFSEHQERRSFSYTSSSSADQQEIADAFVELINADAVCKDYLTASETNNGADYGIKLLAKAQTYSKNDGYEQINFEVALDDAFTNATRIDEKGYVYLNGATPTTVGSTSVAPDPGVGTYELVCDMENFALGQRGLTNRTGFPTPSGLDLMAEATEKYDIYVIAHDDIHASANLNGYVESPLATIIAIPYDAAAGNGGALEALLNPWLNSCPRAFAPVTL